MKITAIKTKKIVAGDTLSQILDGAIKELREGDVLAITSKVVSICEGSIAAPEQSKERLVIEEADYILEGDRPYGMALTIKRNIIIPNAGIDESNIESGYVLWPKDPQKTANELWTYLRAKYNVKNLGIVITDSKTTPLRRGTTGVAMAHCGFTALNNYIGKSDLFGRPMQVSMANVAEGLAATAVLVMGEGSEQTPVAVISGSENITFVDHIPSKEELDVLNIGLDEDIYSPILKNAKWRKL
jgi:putative folate metabolism gamma-glutamate ligase